MEMLSKRVKAGVRAEEASPVCLKGPAASSKPAITLGGAWLVKQKQAEALEAAASSATSEAEQLRAMLKVIGDQEREQRERGDNLAARLRQAENCIRAQHARVQAGASEARQTREELERLRAAESGLGARNAECREALTEMESECGRLQAKLAAAAERERIAAETEAALRVEMAREERRAVCAEESAARQKERGDTLLRAKEAKDKHVAVLVKERERLQVELANVRLAASRMRLKSTAPSPPGAAGSPPAPPGSARSSRSPRTPASEAGGASHPRGRSKLSPSEDERLSKYTGPERLKRQLREKAEQVKFLEEQVKRLEMEKRDMQTRYRNARKAKTASK